MISFLLESIRNNRYYPRLDVKPGIVLSSILLPVFYSLDSAIIRIYDHGTAGNSLPSEARRILTMYGAIRRLDLTDTNITLDPKPFSSLGTEQMAITSPSAPSSPPRSETLQVSSKNTDKISFNMIQ